MIREFDAESISHQTPSSAPEVSNVEKQRFSTGQTVSALARLIKTAGIEVVSFSSAREFLEDPIRNEVDCAVTDVRMRGVDGFKLQETLAQTLPYLSVVFITGHGDIPMSVRAIRGGAVDFLEKPVEDEALMEAVRRASERSRDQKASRC